MIHPDFNISIKEFPGNMLSRGPNSMSVAGFIFLMTRNSGAYYWTYIIPCTLMVILSWVSFLIKPEIVPGRIGLLITLLLMLINLSNTASRASPSSDNLNPLLAWIQASVAFVFLALVEYAFILFTIKFSGQHLNSVYCSKNTGGNSSKCPPIKATKEERFLADGLALIVFPVCYGCFVLLHKNLWLSLTKFLCLEYINLQFNVPSFCCKEHFLFVYKLSIQICLYNHH